MVRRDLDQDDPDTVGVGDPHLDQAPRLAQRRAHDVHAERLKPMMLAAHVTHLQPQRHRPHRVMQALTGDFEEATAEEEDKATVRGLTELATHRESQHVTVEALRALQIRGPKQNPAGEYVHQMMMTR